MVKLGCAAGQYEFKCALDYLVNVASGKETGSGHVRALAFWTLAQNKRLTGDGPVRVGDVVEVEIELKLKLDEGHHFVALLDPLPAGLVAVNSARDGGAASGEER